MMVERLQDICSFVIDLDIKYSENYNDDNIQIKQLIFYWLTPDL